MNISISVVTLLGKNSLLCSFDDELNSHVAAVFTFFNTRMLNCVISMCCENTILLLMIFTRVESHSSAVARAKMIGYLNAQV